VGPFSGSGVQRSIRAHSPPAQPDPVAIGRNQGCDEHWEGIAYKNFSGGEQR
jgi:hypothetical protein